MSLKAELYRNKLESSSSGSFDAASAVSRRGTSDSEAAQFIKRHFREGNTTPSPP
jgi:hypothetical protein